MNPPSALQDVVWDLDHLVAGPTGVDAALDEATELATAFAETYRGALAEIDSAGLAQSMHELAKINDLVGRAGSYAQLRFSTDTADPERGALMQRVEERGTALETMLLFFELEWAGLDDARAEQLLAGDGLEFCTHYLRTARRYRPHLLTEPEERVFAEKALTGRNAWGRLFEELTSALEVELEETVSLDMALSRLAAPARDVRRSAAEAVTKALQPGLRTRAFVFNTLLADKATDDRLRHYPNWLSGRNLANEASDESVAALIDAVRNRYGLARRWYTLKAELLGIDKLADYDRMAPVSTEDVRVDWTEASEMVLDAYSSFSPRLGNLVGRFFDEGWIDAPPGPRKRGGAFCAYTVPSVHPYVMLNFTGRRRDVLTLAHELGHGVHAALAAEQGIYHQHTPLTLAETASVFGEALTFGRLLDAAPTPASRLALLAEDIEGAIATVFRQVAMNRFESLVHTDRRENGELAVDRFNELWTQSQTELLGESVEITGGYQSWWSYVPHFINVPGYVYAYAYGQLLALSVYQRHLEEGGGFAEKYLGLLAAGGSRSPQELGALVGIDLADPGFWDSGLDLVQRQLEAAEAAAREVH
jgi:oligoendopeptidase F